MWGSLFTILAAILLPLIKLIIDKAEVTQEARKSFYEFYDHFRSQRGIPADMGQSYDEQLDKLNQKGKDDGTLK